MLSVLSVCLGFVHDTVLPHHVPKDCACAAWGSNASSATLWSDAATRAGAASSCAMPANAMTPDLALPIYSPSDGWCLCDAGADSQHWYTWCSPPPAHPSQLNLLLLNASAVSVNFVTADGGARAAGCGCTVEAELREAAPAVVLATRQIRDGFSTLYRDSTSSRALSYHHVAMTGLAERTRYKYRVRVANCSSARPPQPPPTWKRTVGIKWCSGGGNFIVGDAFGQGVDGSCPLLPAGLSSAEKVALCEAVCAAPNASACAGFTWYPSLGHNLLQNVTVGECCFRLVTSYKPPSNTSDAECYEKVRAPGPLPCSGGGAAPATDTAWSEWLGFQSLYSSGVTRAAIYADMGVFVSEAPPAPPTRALPAPARHNVGNLVDDLRAGLIDFAVHSGDHAYEFEVNGGARGDGYMDGYSAFLAHAPWAPGWGNHEYLEEDRGNRLANITAGIFSERVRRGAGGNAATRMFYSVDVGLMHLLHLDLSPYWCRFSGCIGVDTCGFPDEWVADASSSDPGTRYDFAGYRAAVLAFARADLAAVDRAKTPWVVMTAHFPMYETYDTAHPRNVAHERSEPDGGARGAEPKAAAGPGEAPVPSKAQAIADFEPLLAEFAVDIYFAGHDHNCALLAQPPYVCACLRCPLNPPPPP